MKEIEDSIEDTLETSDLTQIGSDIAEIGIDSLLKDGVGKNLPVVNTIVGLTKFGLKVREHILLKKILKLLTQLDSTTVEERKKFINDVETNESYNKRVGLALILILDKLEDLEKPKLIGKILAASIKGLIDYETFLRLSNIVQKIFLPDLKNLEAVKEGEELSYQKQDELYLSGLMVTSDTGGARFDGRNEYEISPIAEKSLEIMKK